MNYSEIADETAWTKIVSTYPDADIYHTYEYSRACANLSGLQYKIIRVRDQDCELVLPVLVRKIETSLGEFFDFSSAYGYPSPLVRGNWDADRLKACWSDLSELHKSRSIVAYTTRLNPFIDLTGLLRKIGEVKFVNKVVSIDLTIPEEEQFRAYRSNHRRDIKKLQRNGVACVEVPCQTHLSIFIELYDEQMKRLNAAPEYFFPREYYDDLFSSKSFETKIFACFHEGQVICSGIFLVGSKRIHYHLGATHPNHQKASPTKLMFDTVRKYGISRNLEAMNLGGGLGGNGSSLFNFKAGFSNRHFDFQVFNSIFDSEIYRDLTEEHTKLAKSQQRELNRKYWPAYRSPFVLTSTG